MGEKTGGIDLGGHIGKLELNGLEVGYGATELFALLGVFQCGFVSALRHTQPKRRNPDSYAIKYRECVDKAVTCITEKILFGDSTIFKDHSRRVARTQAEFVFLFACMETRGALLHDECRNAVVAGVLVRDSHCHADVAIRAVR